MPRIIGVRHRVKKTSRGEARPTQMYIIAGVEEFLLDLETEMDELDFVHGQLPRAYRKVTETDDLSELLSRHIKWRAVKKDEKIPKSMQHLTRRHPKTKALQVAMQVPVEFDGLRADDTMLMTMGGSGDQFAVALADRAKQIGAKIFRVPSAKLAHFREVPDKDKDAKNIVELWKTFPEWFYAMEPEDRTLTLVRECYRELMDAMKDRIAASQRKRQIFRKQAYLHPEKWDAEREFEEMFKEYLDQDPGYGALEEQEMECDRALLKALESLPVYREVFKEVEGIGHRIAGRIIASAVDIRRFWVDNEEEEMQKLYKESQRLEYEGRFKEDYDKIFARTNAETTHFQKLQMIRSWKRTNGKENEAILLDRAIECHQKRAQLRRKGVNRFVAYCGVHVLNGGKYEKRLTERQFVRTRVLASGETEGHNWSRDARGGLYLASDQFNRRPESAWGQKLRVWKGNIRSRHPEPVSVQKRDKQTGQEKAVTRYTDGHIHRMALWRAATRFARYVYREWTKLEKERMKRQKTLPVRKQEAAWYNKVL